MAKIYVSIDRDDSELYDLFFQALSRDNELDVGNVEVFKEWKKNIKHSLWNCDVVVALITERYLTVSQGKNELITITSYVDNYDGKLFIPIVIGEIDTPSYLDKYNVYHFDVREIGAIDLAVDKINSLISNHLGRVIADNEYVEEKRIIFEKNASEYIDEAIRELKSREESLNKKANFWYWMGYGAIAVGVLCAGVVTIVGGYNFGDASRWDLVAFVSIKSVVLIGLLLALAKYSLTLGKSYMDESLKNSDRIHAISFGKFYLQAFEDHASPGEMKDIFQHWNISSGNSFGGMSADIIEPKVLELIIGILKATKNSDKK